MGNARVGARTGEMGVTIRKSQASQRCRPQTLRETRVIAVAVRWEGMGVYVLSRGRVFRQLRR